MMAEKTPQELLQISLKPRTEDWMNPSIDFEARRGTWSYPGSAKAWLRTPWVLAMIPPCSPPP